MTWNPRPPAGPPSAWIEIAASARARLPIAARSVMHGPQPVFVARVRTTPQRTASPTEAADCLNTVQFLVDHGVRTVTGSAPDGVNFIARFYGSDAEANAALSRLNPKYAVVMGRAVINFAGNPPAHPGG